jgi:anti-sigma regulatory factor (Ser/Thr protein kinase)
MADSVLPQAFEKESSSVLDKHQDHNFTLTFPATVDHINSAQQNFVRFLTSLNIQEITVFELATVFYEVATNIRSHGDLTDTDSIEFSVSYTDRSVLMEFTDPGRPFKIPKILPDFDPREVIAQKKTHGFGLILIDRLTDGITYERIDNEYNVLKLKKQWR